MRWACLRACRSEPQMPQASVLTSTCAAAGFGWGSVSTTISPFRKIAARIGVSLAFLLLSGFSLRPSPRIARNALSGIGPRHVGELALEGDGGGPAVQPIHLGGRRGQRRIVRLRRAVDDEGRARQRLEYRGDAAIGVEIMRPGGAAAQRQN